MIATDPLSLLFVACIIFAGTFLIVTTLLGAGHVGHVASGHGHIGQVHLGHGAETAGSHGMHLGHGAATQAASSHVAAIPAHPTLGARVALPHHTSNASNTATGSGTGGILQQFLGGINLNSVLMFLFCFGLLGYVLHNSAHAGSFVAFVVALIAGIGGGAAINALMLRFYGQETGRLGFDSSTFEGRIARVSIPVRAGGLGEIIYVGDNGSRRSLGARSVDGTPVDRDVDVVIVGYANGVATIETWDAFLLSAGTQTPS